MINILMVYRSVTSEDIFGANKSSSRYLGLRSLRSGCFWEGIASTDGADMAASLIAARSLLALPSQNQPLRRLQYLVSY